ncbi:GNAT family N-acetyltransferase [Umezawaea tangerina]|uniref:Acetyltransferase (GNAT) family protein n=1 Tax=Umezawaea tangerina TaxID=84725 RepID=A0A2T0SLQ3_9PSEU|nr:GNAT family N-acetyltransferase [Umezawaea tangerina]PRY34338.1 acetyltransferase (GNAT) family protein [Umezawaea tangerina]
MIERVAAPPAEDLADVLVDAVEGGASVGFVLPLDRADAVSWWEGLAPAVADGSLLLWVARVDGEVVGTVQVRLATLPNARHRGELAKLLVHRSARGRGVARALVRAAEREAAAAGVTLLVLDTETGSPAHSVYAHLGWTEVGTIPDYALDPEAKPRPTTIFYKRIP